MGLPGACGQGGIFFPGRTLGEQELDLNSDGSCSDDDSANEYAEGLGCADSKACCRLAESQFEFDNHPREEYFEQPSPDLIAISSDEELEGRPAPKRPRVSHAFDAGHDSSSHSMLAGLQHEEEAQLLRQQGRIDAVRRQLSKVSRHCNHRDAKRAALTAAAPKRSGSMLREEQLQPAAAMLPKSETSVTPCTVTPPPCMAAGTFLASLSETFTLGDCSATGSSLFSVRAELTRLRGLAAASERREINNVPNLLMQCESFQISAESLRASGLGRELNSPFWRQHPSVDISRRSRALVRGWRRIVRTELRQKHSREGGA